MRSFIALTVKDLKGYFEQPTGYILLVVFVGILTYLFFRTAFDLADSSLRPLFTTLPWLFAVFIPATTMRLMAEEERDGTLETLITYPLQDWVIVASKFTAALLFVCLGLLSTVAIPLMLQFGGSVDVGAAVAQYIGAFLLAASMVAIGLFTSSISRDQIVAFVAGLGFNIVLLLIGSGFVLTALPVGLVTLLHGISPLTHFDSITRGVLDLRDAVYFLLLVFTFLTAAFFSLRSKTVSHFSRDYRMLQVTTAGLVVLSLLAGWFGGSIRGRWDLTEGHRYTLSAAMSDVVGGLDDLLTVRLYASDNLPVQVRQMNRDVNDFLEDLDSISSNVRVVRSFPDEDENDAWWAQHVGVSPVELNVLGEADLQLTRAYFGLSITYLDRHEVIPFIGSTYDLEYRLASMIGRMLRSEPKRVAFISGHGELLVESDLVILKQQLDQQYDVVELVGGQSGENNFDLGGLDLLIVPGLLEDFLPEEEQALHRYLDHGGSMLLLAEPVQVLQSQDGRLGVSQVGQAAGKFIRKYGLTIEQSLIYDPRNNEAISISQGPFVFPVPYGYWPRAEPVKGTIPGDVDSIALWWASPIQADISNDLNVEVIPLLQVSPFAVADSKFGNVTPAQEDFDPGSELTSRLTGVAVIGPSKYKENIEAQESSYRLAVFGDVDWLTDRAVSGSPENMLYALNVIDWLAQEDALAAIRSKVITSSRLSFGSKTEMDLVQYGSMIGIPLVIVSIGALLHLRRRRLIGTVYGDDA